MQVWLNSLSDDIVWTVAGSKENSGQYKGKQTYIDEVLGSLNKWVKQPPVPELKKLIVDGDEAAVWLRAQAEALDGKTFTIDYCWLIRVADNKVTEVIGFYA